MSEHDEAGQQAATAPVGSPEPATGPSDPQDQVTADDHRTPRWQLWRRSRRSRDGASGKQKKEHRKAPWWELPALVALAIGIAVVVKTFVVQPFYIPSDSMEQTLHGCPGCHGDRILVNKLIYDFRDPHPGDIVVFHAPPGWNDEPSVRPPSNPILRVMRGFGQLIGFVPPDGQILVKRVIAVGGQTVKGDARGNVYVSDNGPHGSYRRLVEPYVYAPKSQWLGPGHMEDPFGPVTIPKGRLWVMGDHRTDSADSRFHCIAGGPESTSEDRHCNPVSSTVPVSDVIGKAFVIAWPPSRWRTLGTPVTFEHDALVAGSVVPGAVGAAVVVPVFFVRRRRRGR
jgi:signal peptidase I